MGNCKPLIGCMGMATITLIILFLFWGKEKTISDYEELMNTHSDLLLLVRNTFKEREDYYGIEPQGSTGVQVWTKRSDGIVRYEVLSMEAVDKVVPYQSCLKLIKSFNAIE